MPTKNLNIQPPMQRKTPLAAGANTALLDYNNQVAAMTAQKVANAPPPEIPSDVLRADGSFADPVELFFPAASSQPPAQPEEPVKKKAGRPKKGDQLAKIDESAKIIDSQREQIILQPNQPQAPKAPSSRQEYVQEHKPVNPEQFPDIADIFKNHEIGDIFKKNVPGMPVATGMIQPPRPPVAALPVQRIEHVITHELPTATAYIVTQKFRAYVRDVFQSFEQSQMIYDVTIIDSLLLGNCPNIKPYQSAANFLICPLCCGSFPQEAAKRLE